MYQNYGLENEQRHHLPVNTVIHLNVSYGLLDGVFRSSGASAGKPLKWNLKMDFLVKSTNNYPMGVYQIAYTLTKDIIKRVLCPLLSNRVVFFTMGLSFNSAGRQVYYKVPLKGRICGEQPSQEILTQMRVILFSSQRPKNTYNFLVKGLPQSVSTSSGEGLFTHQLIEALLTRDLVLPIYENIASSTTFAVLDLAELALKEREEDLEKERALKERLKEIKKTEEKKKQTNLTAYSAQSEDSEFTESESEDSEFTEVEDSRPTEGKEKDLKLTVLPKKERWTQLKEQFSTSAPVPVSTKTLTVRYVKIVTETSIKKTKKKGIDDTKTVKNNIVITFESANVLLG